MNPMTLIDGYKLDHRRQYPTGTTRVYSNWTPRDSRVPGQGKVVYFGGQYFRKRYLEEEFRRFFDDSEDVAAKAYSRRVDSYLGPNSIGEEHVRALHRLGYLPLRFCALPEGTAVSLRIPMLTLENTHPDFAWLPNYFETLLSNVLWLPCTSATTALRMRSTLEEAARKTGGDLAFVDWQGHDFSFRGMSSPEAAALSGAAHLLYFTGTDTIPALDLIDDYYPVPEGYLVGASVAATEHSVMCAGGPEGELETFDRLLTLYPSGIVSIVSDTWDLWKVLTEILPKLQGRIMGREGKLVIRPDSGNPADVLCGSPVAPKDSPAAKGVVELLWDLFGGTRTATGHKLLDQHVGCIYGDSITRERAEEICRRLEGKGLASTNCVFGIGSYTYQHVTRDTYGFAMKATWVEVDGKGRDIYKTPKTDGGVKNSARGRLSVLKDSIVGFRLIEQATPEQEAESLLKPVWVDGLELRPEGFDAVRKRARAQLPGA